MRRFVLLLAILAFAVVPLCVSAQADATPISIGDSVEGELTAASPSAVYSIQGEAGSAVLITLVSDDFDPLLVVSDANGNQLATDDDSAGNLDSQLTFTFLEDGEYLITATSFAAQSGLTGATGAYTLTLEPSAGNVDLSATAVPQTIPTGNATPISAGDTVSGTLTSNAPSSLYSFQGEAGTSVRITLVSEDFDCYLVLSDSNGNVLATDDDSAGNLDSRIDFAVPADGEYLIEATSFAAHNGSTPVTGSYTLSLNTVEIETIEYGETVQGTLTNDALSQLFTFTAAPGDSVIIRLESDDFDSYLRLNDASGVEVAYNDDGAGNLNSLIGPIALAQGGVYTINASSLSGSSTGNFTLSLSAANVQPITVGEPLNGELTPSDNKAFFTLDGHAGDTISISVTSSIDTNVAVNDPSNYQVAFDEDGGKGNNPEITDLVLTSDGTYTIVVGSAFNETGEFELLVERAELPSLNDGPVTLSYNSSTTTRVIQYTAEAGEVLRLTIASTNGQQINPSVDASQNGSQVYYASANYVTELSSVFTVPSSGDITLTISDYSYDNRQVEIRISSAE
ncbi:MAG: PPC domain-containing protein [Anaerolineae bacterium]